MSSRFFFAILTYHLVHSRHKRTLSYVWCQRDESFGSRQAANECLHGVGTSVPGRSGRQIAEIHECRSQCETGTGEILAWLIFSAAQGEHLHTAEEEHLTSCQFELYIITRHTCRLIPSSSWLIHNRNHLWLLKPAGFLHTPDSRSTGPSR